MSLLDIGVFRWIWEEKTKKKTSVTVTRPEQKYFEGRRESQEKALRKTPAPWSAEPTGKLTVNESK